LTTVVHPEELIVRSHRPKSKKRFARPIGNPNTAPSAGCALRRLSYEMLEDRRMLSVVQWMGGTAGYWDQPSNWSNQAVPTPADDVSISTPSATITIQPGESYSVNSITVAASDTLVMSGAALSVSANSTISGTLTATGGSLSATGSGVTFAASGPTSADSASFYAYNGATLSMPQLTSYADVNNDSPTFYASSAGSTVNLAGLTGLSDFTNWLYIQARSGGEVNLSMVSSITNSYVNISADGTGTGSVPSKIDFSALSTLSEAGGPYGDLSATNGGDLIDPLLTAPNGVNITIGNYNASAPSQMNTSQLTSLTGSSLSLYQAVSFSGLTDIDGTGLYVYDGTTLSLPQITSYSLTNNDSPTFQANDAGSLINLPGLTSISGLTNWLYVFARSGGEVKLSNVTGITNSYVNISADGTGTGNVPSTIDFSKLNTLAESGGPYANMSATDGGDLIDPLLTAPNGVNITIGNYNASAPSQMNTSQLTSLTGSSLSLYQAASFSGLTDIDGTGLYVYNGTTLSLPQITSYSLTNNDSPTFQANDAGSLINLPGLTSISGLTNWLYIFARSGGEIKLSNVTSITNSYVNISADGTGTGNVSSTIDFSKLNTLSESGGPYANMSATDGGDLIDPLLTAPDGVNLTIGSYNAATLSQMNTSQLTSLTGSSLSVYQAASFSGLTNINGTGLYAYNGATLSLPQITSYSLTNNDSPTFQANDAGSLINLPGLTSISGMTNWLYVFARTGGEVKLSNVTSITNSYVNISADGTSAGNAPSKIDFSALNTLSESGGPYANMSATNGGDLIDPLLTAPNGVNITIGDYGAATPSQMNTSQLTSLTSSSISLYQAASFSGLTDIDGTSLYVYNGTTLSLPQVTSFSLTNNNSATFQANDAGSMLNLTGLTSFSGLTNWLYVYARTGGKVNLSKVANITNSYVNFSADGSAAGNVASTIDFSGLTSFSETSYEYGNWSATNGGTILAGNLASLSSTVVSLDGTGEITNEWTSLKDDSVYVTGGSYTFNNVADIDGSNFYIQNGGQLSLPSVTSVTGTNSNTYLQANGSGSTLSLPALATITATNNAIYVQAYNGGEVLLPAVNTLTGTYVYFTADGAGSTIDLASLQNYTQLNASATNGGTIVYMPSTPVFTWTGAGDGTSWNNPANWSSDQVPGPLDDAVIDLAGNPTIVYNAAAGNTTIHALTCSDTLSITGGSLTVTANSTVSGSFSMTGGTLAASGANVTLTVGGSTTVSDASLFAEAGASVSLPALTSYTHNNTGYAVTLEATGAGSTLTLPMLSGLTVAPNYGTLVNIEALAGGNVSLPALAQINTGTVQLISDGASSVLNVPALTAFSTTPGSWTYSLLQASNSGKVQDTGLTSLIAVSLVLNAGGSFTLGSLTDLDNSNVTVEGGASLSLPAVTSYTHNYTGYTVTLEATGAGSTLTLPMLSGLTVAPNYGTVVNIEALAGGNVSLPALAQINTGTVQLISDGASSVVNVPALTAFSTTPGSWTNSLLQASNGGTVQDPLLTTLASVNLPIDGVSSESTSQIASYTSGILTLSHGTLTLGNLTDLDNSSVTVQSGASLSLPDVTSYSHNNTGNTVTLEATGAGSTLTLPMLGGLTVAPNYGTLVYIEALAGGNVSLPALAQINTGTVQLISDGASSVLNVPALTAFSTTPGSWTYSLLQASNSGKVQDTGLTSLIAVNLVLNTGSSLTLGSLNDLDNSNVTVEGGTSLSLPAVTSYTHNYTGYAVTLEATGAGSTLTLPNLSGLTVAPNYGTVVNIDALAGGNVSLPALAQINTGTVQLISDGTSSVLNVPALTAFSTTPGSWTYSLLQASNSGKVQDTGLTSLIAVSLVLNTGSSFTLGSLNDLDNSNVTVEGGTSLSLPAVTSYTHNYTGYAVTLEATGAGSTLTLPMLSGLTVAPNYGTLANIEALAGGNVSLPALAQINTGTVQLISDGASSVLNVSALTAFSTTPGSWTYSLLQASNSGKIQDTGLTSLIAVSLVLSTGSSFTLGSLTDLDNSNVTVEGGASLSLPAVTSYTHNYTGFTVTLEATGAGSTLTLPMLSGLTVAPNYGTVANIEALAGGNVNLPALTSIGTGPLSLLSDGTSSMLDLSALKSFLLASGSWTTSTLQASNNGTVYFGQLPAPAAQGLLIDAGGQLTLGSGIQLSGAMQNAGSLTLAGPLNLSGSYTQTAGATLVEQIGGTQTGQFGSLTATQTVALAGTLDIALTGGFQPVQGNSTPMLAGTITGQFGSVVNVSPGSADTFNASYTPSTVSVVATTVLLPNLAVGMVSAPATAVPGQTIPISWTDVNQGTAAATGSWVDRIYLYTSPTGNNPVLLESVPFNGTLAAGQSDPLSAMVDLTTVQPGTYYFGVTADYFHQVIETSTVHQNTTISSQPTLIDVPDLVAQSLQASVNAAQFGQSISVTWTVKNNGSAAAAGDWTDQLYLSSQPSLNANSTPFYQQTEDAYAPLGAGASYTTTAQVTLPLSASSINGTYYIVVLVNYTQSLAESTINNNQAASSAINLTLPALPSLGVSGLSTAAHAVYPGQTINLSWTVTNHGGAAAIGPWNDEVYLASDAQGDNETLLATFPNGSSLAPAANYTSTEQVVLPTQATGQEWLVVTADPESAVLEPGTAAGRTQIDSTPLTFGTYTVTAQTSATVVNAGTPIAFTGTTRTLGGTSVPDVPVAISITTAGTVRTITATSNAQGTFTATFQPLSTEAGTYTYAAGLPGGAAGPTLGQFEIVGMSVSSQSPLNLAPGVPVSGSETVTNLGPIPLSGITVTVVGAPANIQVQASPASTSLAGSASMLLNFTVTASNATVTTANVILLVKSTEGAATELTLPLSVLPLVPELAAEPGTLLDSMLVAPSPGSQTIVQFNVVNNGGAASGAMQVLVPQAPFLTLTSPAEIGPLAPGQSTTVTLQLLPAANLALGSYTGTISLLGATTSLNVPFQFTAVSQAVGSVVVDAQDELTFLTQGAPLVAGASVILSNPQTGVAEATGTTGAGGTLELDGLQVGPYNVLVQAKGHNAYQGTVTVQAGMTATVDALMTSQLVTYQFNVTPTTIQDQYTFTVNTTFTAHVPIPVVTVSPAYIDFSTLTAATTQINFTLTNQGLEAAQGVGLNFQSDNMWQVTPLVSSLGILPAGSSITVPVIVQRLSGQQGASSGPGQSDGGQPSDICPAAYAFWHFICDNQQLGYSANIAYLNAGGSCPPGIPIFPVATGGGGGGGIIYTAGASTPVKTLNLCDPKDAQKLLDAAKDLALTAIGALGGPVAGAITGLYGLYNDAGKGDLVGVGLDIGGFIPGVGSAIGIIGGMRSIYNDLADPPQNVTPQLSAAMAQLQTETDRLQAVANVVIDFFGSADWVSLPVGDNAGLDQETAWFQAFLSDATGPGGSALEITSAQQTALLAMPLPAPITAADAANFIARWNNTVAYNAQGIINQGDVPPGQSANFLAVDVLQAYVLAAQSALNAYQTEGYTNLYDATTAAANSAMNAFQLANDTGICATVQLQISQQATVARSAFSASFELDNQKPSDTLTNISVSLHVYTMTGTDVTSLFFISAPTLTGLSAVDGTGTLAPGTSGTANWTIIPTNAAAADGITNYLVDGTLSYFDNVQVTVPIVPSTITVYPAPSLHVSYFLQQDVYGDDPFTPQVETPQPFALGLLVTNTGPGDAGDFTITSSQPQIIDNKKGLLVNFDITGAQVGNQAATPSLTADLGTIDSGQTVVADWQMTTSLDGTFSNMSATYQHSDALGGAATSIIDSVNIYDMTHMVQPNRAGDNGDPAFLVDSNPQPGNPYDPIPDTIYLADGTTAPVNLASNPVVSAPVSANNLDVTLTANETSGWDYLEVPDPGVGFKLIKVTRSDGTQILVGPDAWTTHPVDAGTNDPSGDLLHILDYNGTGSYTLYYLPVNALPPAAVSLAAVSPNPTSGPVASLNLTLSEPVDPATFNRNDVTLTLNNGPNLINSGVTLTLVSGSTFQIGGLSSLTSASGLYQLSVLPGVVQDSAGELSTGTVLSNWANGNVGPYVVSVGSVTSPRNTPVGSVNVVFDKPVNLSTFNYHAVSLTLNGGANLITSGVSVSQVSGSTYQISGLSGLTTAQGVYTLTVNAAAVQDAGGLVGLVSDTNSGSWTMDTTPPTATLQVVTQSPRSIIVPTMDVTFSAAINPATFTLSNISFSKTGGPNLVNSSTTITQLSPTEFEVSGFNNFIYPVDGTYTFTVSAAGVMDLAGNTGTASVSESWVMETNPPDPPTNLAVTPGNSLSAGSFVTNTGSVTLTGSVDQTGLLLDVYDGAAEIVTDAPIQGESISMPLSLAEGSHNLKVDVVDVAASVSDDADLTVLVDQIAPVVTIQPVTPNVLSAPLPSITITFSKPVYGFTLADLQLTDGNGPNLLPSGSPTLTSSDNQTWTLGNLTGLTTNGGNYTLTLSPAGIEDAAGNALATGGSITFAESSAPGVSIAAVSPNPRNAPVNSLSITFTKAVYGFDPAADLSLSANGGENLLTSAQALTTSDNVTWTLNNLAGLTAANGTYVLTLTPAGITDAAGNTLAAGASTTFLVDTVRPTSAVTALPAVSLGTQFLVQWAGHDNAGGSGIASFDIFVQDNGGPFTLWQSNTTATSATYTGVAGQTYGFYSLATDNAGNQEVKTAVADTSTLIQAASTVAVSSNYASGAVYGQSIMFTANVTSNDPAAGTPSGTVQFAINGTNLGSAITLVNGQASIAAPNLNAASYTITVTYTSNNIDFSNGNGMFVQKVSPAPVQLGLQSNTLWDLANQQLSFTATASTTATMNGSPLTPDGSVTFYNNGMALNSVPLSGVSGQDQAGFSTSSLSVGEHLITVGYTSSSGNYAMSVASPVLLEMVYSGTANILTVTNTSSNANVSGSLPWAVAQANAATVITFAAGNGQTFATPQTITLEAPLNITTSSLVGIEGPASGVTLVGDYSSSRFPVLGIAQVADVSLRGVNIGTQSPGANGDLAVAGVLDVLQAVGNLGSAVSVTAGGTIDLGGQTVTADSLTLTSGNVIDGTLSSGKRTVVNGVISANLAGSGGMFENAGTSVVLSGNNTYTGGTTVASGLLTVNGFKGLPAGSALIVGAGASTAFGPAAGGSSSNAAAAVIVSANSGNPQTAVATASSEAPLSVSLARITAGSTDAALIRDFAQPAHNVLARNPVSVPTWLIPAANWWADNQDPKDGPSLQALDKVLAEYGVRGG
jgi:autotransporter-associated beta strand protein